MKAIYDTYLKQIRESAEEIAGQWNGDESGVMEEKATTANEIVEKCEEIQNLINYLNEF